METNSYKMISLPEVRDRIKLRLKQFNTTINDDAIDLFIMDASRDIMSKKKVEPKTESIEIVDFAAPLPCDFDTLLAIVTCPCGEFDAPMVYSNFNFDGSSCNQNPIGNEFKIVGGYLRFPTNINFDAVTIFYNAFITDDEGFPMLPDSHVLYYSDYATARMWEMEGNINMAQYFSGKAIKRRQALIHNELVTEWELDKEAFRATIYSMVGSYNRFRYGFNNSNSTFGINGRTAGI